MIPLRQSSGMVFPDPYTMLIVYASHLIIESPPFLRSSAVMEPMPGARLFLRRLITKVGEISKKVPESRLKLYWHVLRKE